MHVANNSDWRDNIDYIVLRCKNFFNFGTDDFYGDFFQNFSLSCPLEVIVYIEGKSISGQRCLAFHLCTNRLFDSA